MVTGRYDLLDVFQGQNLHSNKFINMELSTVHCRPSLGQIFISKTVGTKAALYQKSESLPAAEEPKPQVQAQFRVRALIGPLIRHNREESLVDGAGHPQSRWRSHLRSRPDMQQCAPRKNESLVERGVYAACHLHNPSVPPPHYDFTGTRFEVTISLL